MSDPIRSRSIAVSPEVFWALRMLAKANHASTGPMETPKGADAIAEAILKQHIHAHHDYLEAIYAKRKAAEDEAVERIAHPL